MGNASDESKIGGGPLANFCATLIEGPTEKHGAPQWRQFGWWFSYVLGKICESFNFQTCHCFYDWPQRWEDASAHLWIAWSHPQNGSAFSYCFYILNWPFKCIPFRTEMMGIRLLGDSQNRNSFMVAFCICFSSDISKMLLHWIILTPYFFLFCQGNSCHFRQDQVMILKGHRSDATVSLILFFAYCLHLPFIPFLNQSPPSVGFPPLQALI